MSTLEDFLPYVRPHVSGLTAPMLTHEIRAAAIRFCERSRAWKGVETMDVVADQARYVAPVPEDARLAVLEEVYFNGQLLQPRALDEMKVRYSNWMAASGTPLFYTQYEPEALTLAPIPNLAIEDGLVMRAHYKPTREAKTLPDFLFDHYAPVIAAGALAELMMMPDLPCYNPQQAMAHQARFDLGADKANTQADRSFTRTARRVVARFM
jgi:hypothetical protein